MVEAGTLNHSISKVFTLYHSDYTAVPAKYNL